MGIVNARKDIILSISLSNTFDQLVFIMNASYISSKAKTINIAREPITKSERREFNMDSIAAITYQTQTSVR